jgi:hypothetical protein
MEQINQSLSPIGNKITEITCKKEEQDPQIKQEANEWIFVSAYLLGKML